MKVKWSVFKRKDASKWTLQVKYHDPETGKMRSRERLFVRKSDAIDHKDEIVAEIGKSHGPITTGEKITFSDFSQSCEKMKTRSQLFSKLLTAEEMSEYLADRVSAEELRDFALSGCPHYTGMDRLWFAKGETEKWLTENVFRKRAGKAMTINIWTTISAAVSDCNLPLELRPIAGALLPMPNTGSISGVYFLCLADEVVYVGQSRNVYSRLQIHDVDPQKKFDRIFLLPCPRHELDVVENTFIRVLQPRLNGKTPAGDCRLLRRVRSDVTTTTATVLDAFLNTGEQQERSNQ